MIKHNIKFSLEDGWDGITPEVMARLHFLYPKLDIDQSLKCMEAWFQANPERLKCRSRWYRFIINWLNNETRYTLQQRNNSNGRPISKEFGEYDSDPGQARCF